MLAGSNKINNALRWILWSAKEEEKTIMLSGYTRANCRLTVVRIVSIALCNVVDAFLSQKSMRVNAYVPKCVVNVALSWSFWCDRDLPIS